MARVKTRLNSGGMKSLLNDEGVRDDLTARMERARAAAIASAPVVTGGYRDSIDLVQDSTDRVAVRLAAKAPHAHLVEARLGVLAKALDAAGGS